MVNGSRPSLAALRAGAVAALRRFPAAMTAAAVATAIVLAGQSDGYPWLFGLAGVFFWSVAIRLPLEAHRGVPALVALVAPWAAGLVFAAPTWLGGGVSAVYILPGAGALAVIAAPLFAGTADRSALAGAWARGAAWTVAVAGAATLVLCIGLTLLIAGFNELFDARLWNMYGRVWTIGFGLFLPWCALALLPRLGQDGDAFSFPRWLAFLLDWLLAPLAIAYGGLLNAYCAFILVRGDLPKGVIATMVVSFAIVGGLVWSAAFAVGPAGGRASRLLSGTFLPGLLAPAVALSVATGMRINQHGVTEERYLLVMVAVLLLVLGAAQVVRRRIPTPSLVALVAAAGLLAASVGPWGATSVSVGSQVGRLLNALERVGRLHDGMIEPTGAMVYGADAVEITSIVLFLASRDEEGNILARFRTPPDDTPFVEMDDKEAARAKALLGAMRVEFKKYDSDPPERHDTEYEPIHWGLANEVPITVSGFDYVVSRLLLLDDSAIDIKKMIDGPLRLHLKSPAALHVSRDGEPLVTFDLNEALTTARLATGTDAIYVDRVAGDGTRLRLRLTRINGRSAAGASRLENVEFDLLLTRKPR